MPLIFNPPSSRPISISIVIDCRVCILCLFPCPPPFFLLFIVVIFSAILECLQ